MKNEWQKRKSTRLKDFDYSTAGLYFVTICIQDRRQILSDVEKFDISLAGRTADFRPVGEGLAPPENERLISIQTDEPLIVLKPCGKIAEEQLLLLEKRFPGVTIEDYIIMPDHIHAVIYLHENAGGASPSPTLGDVVCAFKSLTSRICKQRYGVEKMFQRSYIEHIVRNRADYETRRKYIYENPVRWYYKHSCTE